jgi:hypothetical protein
MDGTARPFEEWNYCKPNEKAAAVVSWLEQIAAEMYYEAKDEAKGVLP